MNKTTKISIAVILLATMGVAACSGLYAPAALLQSSPEVTATPIVIPNEAQISSSLDAYQNTLEQIYARVNPSVVNVEVVQSQTSSLTPSQTPFGFGNPGNQAQRALGSGFVWDKQGHIVTNNHVIDGASQITVTFSDGTVADAKLIGNDPESDLAVIQVDVPESKLQPVELTDSTQIKVGQVAIAIGNPFGLSGTMTVGIISGLQRTLPVNLNSQVSQQSPTYSIPDIIQTDASINPGNSGGVLVDDQGRLIGVTSAIASPVDANAGVGFAIPSLIVQKVVPSLIQTGSYQHPRLGISGTSITPDLAAANNLDKNQQGVLVVEVAANGPAAKAGVKGSNNQASVNSQVVPAGGDVIVAVDHQPVNRFEDLESYLFENTQVGQTVTLTILRNGQQKDIPVTLGVVSLNNP